MNIPPDSEFDTFDTKARTLIRTIELLRKISPTPTSDDVEFAIVAARSQE